MRTIIDLTDEQLAALKEICDEEGISRAEAIRRAVDLLDHQRAQRDTAGDGDGERWELDIDPRELARQLRNMEDEHVMREPHEPYQVHGVSSSSRSSSLSSSRLSSYATSWYDDAVKTIIDLPEEQVIGLDAVCARDVITRTEAIRRAVGSYLEDEDRKEHERVIAQAFGAWARYGVSTDDYLAEIRKEWEH